MSKKSTNNTIYKYRGWNNDYDKASLKANQLYLSSPEKFNDPFDCNIPANFISMNEKDKSEYINKMMNVSFGGLIMEKKKLDKMNRFLINRLTNEIEDVQNEYEKDRHLLMNKHLGIISLSGRWDSILMWSHYGDKHKGYCIGYDLEKLVKSEMFDSSGFVTYPNDLNYPKISPIKDDLPESHKIATSYKAYDWKYENEFRLTRLSFPNPLNDNERIVKRT